MRNWLCFWWIVPFVKIAPKYLKFELKVEILITDGSNLKRDICSSKSSKLKKFELNI